MLFLIMSIVIIFLLIYLFYIEPFGYWKRRGVIQGAPVPLFGDYWGQVLPLMTFKDFTKFVYNIAPHNRYCGIYIFYKPALVIRDPELIKTVMVKGFDYFVDHRTIVPENYDPLWGNNLIGLKGDKWKNMRAVLSPSFTSKKLKTLFIPIVEIVQEVNQYILAQNEKIFEIETEDIFGRILTDIIATAVFGVKVNSLTSRDNQFYQMGKEAGNFKGISKNIKFFIAMFFPQLYNYFKISFFSKEVQDFFKALVGDTIAFREKTLTTRSDMINLLMEARRNFNKSKNLENTESFDKIEITNEFITSQALLFFLAGFDTTSSVMSFLSYELAMNPDIQQRLTNEIDEVMNMSGEQLTMEGISGMKYLDMVISESMRKWPGFLATDRVCTKDYTIFPELEREVPVLVEKNTILYFPIYAIHHDPNYFPDPERFDPERFNDENKLNISSFTYIPFGFGPRTCLGSRFALMVVKTIFTYLLYNFEIVPTEKTAIPIKLSKTALTLHAEGGIWLGLKRRMK